MKIQTLGLLLLSMACSACCKDGPTRTIKIPVVIEKPAKCLPATPPLVKNLRQGDLALGGQTLSDGTACPEGAGACLTPTGIARVRSSLAELIEWYKETSTRCGGTDDEETDRTHSRGADRRDPS